MLDVASSVLHRHPGSCTLCSSGSRWNRWLQAGGLLLQRLPVLPGKLGHPTGHVPGHSGAVQGELGLWVVLSQHKHGS